MAIEQRGHPNSRAFEALSHILPRSAEVSDDGKDRVVINGTSFRVRWVGEGWLRNVRSLLADLTGPSEIVVARRMSPGARAELAKAGVGWVDETGAAEIAAGPIVISRSGHAAKTKQRVDRWTPAVLSVAEALICGADATVAGTQTATGLSTGSCGNALRFLVDRGLLTASAERGPGSGRRVPDPDALLDAYAGAAAEVPDKISLQVGVVWRDTLAGLATAGERWDAAGRVWACTAAAAAAVMAPYLSSVTTADVYVDTETIAGLEAAAADAGFEPIDGGRLRLRPFPTTAARLRRAHQEGLWLAPWPRVYADLRVLGVRGEEAAEHLREVLHVR